MVFDHGKLIIPGRLISNGSRVISFCFPFHRHPEQMGHPDRNTKRRLPVSLKFIGSEVAVPSCHPIKLRKHGLCPHLMNNRLSLLCSRVFTTVTENINSRYSKMPVTAHGFSQCLGLTFQFLLVQYMAGQRNFVLPAPVSDLPAIGFYESIRHMVVILIPQFRYPPLWQFPDQLGKTCQKILSVFL